MTLRDDEPIIPPQPTWRRWFWVGGGVVAVVVVLVVALVVVPLLAERANRCGPGVQHTGERGECIGITDGAYVFDDELAPVENLIRAENDAIGQQPSVSVVLMLPMTLQNPDVVTIEWVRHQLEGAHLAQREANRDDMWFGRSPRIRLLLANPGSGVEHWRPVVDELQRRRTDEHIVAVTGIGLSYGTAVDAMRALSEAQMPVIGSTLTADNLSEIRGFARVSPTNAAQARAAATYLKQRAHTALLVQDTNPNDLYPRTLADEFRRSFEDDDHRFVGRTEPYMSDAGGVEATIHQMMPNVCQTKPEVVYFAGRSRYITTLITALAERPCPRDPIKVVTGDDLAMYGTPSNAVQVALENNVSVFYTGLAHPQAWQRHPESFNGQSISHFTRRTADRNCELCFADLFPGETLDDGFALIAYDAVATVVWAAHKMEVEGRPVVSEGRQVEATDILQLMNRMHGAVYVRGASGTISFDERGNPVNKPVPILQLRPEQSPEFVDLAWPDS
ncbi:ABC transporter substrate-binding protein [Nocardia mexicana]|uniref:ABC-type branched-subunit amino acid transport system substrate-binding protein n=1 Tax=Nocardia mexicana TaxID=279262 RepID=A0A370GLI3_9NOCA|nr:ABC transporter substrate-binding protein [Nocardia mexicana]RDI44507.1 ABC-type branched-subunit amino acid transport system substrate-binding protein [Nocardia mexicana]